ncbi:unnamed protein product [Thlaspi arvense]|uniref:Cytochrome P450 76AD1-like protein n=1 Tax=Thlaspi arvense TaxID=13288 RepID=A0AAU9RM47_THLAR|nr:unnamed protein product [Thlaspi arvense]
MEFLNLFQFTLLFSALIFGLRLFRRRKLPPGPIGLPRVGNLFEIGTKPHQSLANLAKKYGPLMTVRLGSKTLVVASSPEMAQQVLQKHDEAFSGRVMSDTITKVQNYDLSLVWMPAGDQSRLIRRDLSALFCCTKRSWTL